MKRTSLKDIKEEYKLTIKDIIKLGDRVNRGLYKDIRKTVYIYLKNRINKELGTNMLLKTSHIERFLGTRLSPIARTVIIDIITKELEPRVMITASCKRFIIKVNNVKKWLDSFNGEQYE